MKKCISTTLLPISFLASFSPAYVAAFIFEFNETAQDLYFFLLSKVTVIEERANAIASSKQLNLVAPRRPVALREGYCAARVVISR